MENRDIINKFVGHLQISRFAPNDHTLSDRIKELIDKKAKKLAKYKCSGKITIILIENNDIALMNTQKMRQANPGCLPSRLSSHN